MSRLFFAKPPPYTSICSVLDSRILRWTDAFSEGALHCACNGDSCPSVRKPGSALRAPTCTRWVHPPGKGGVSLGRRKAPFFFGDAPHARIGARNIMRAPPRPNPLRHAAPGCGPPIAPEPPTEPLRDAHRASGTHARGKRARCGPSARGPRVLCAPRGRPFPRPIPMRSARCGCQATCQLSVSTRRGPPYESLPPHARRTRLLPARCAAGIASAPPRLPQRQRSFGRPPVRTRWATPFPTWATPPA